MVCGNGSSGALGLGVDTNRDSPTLIPGLSNIIKVCGGLEFSYAVASNGSVYSWGLNRFGQLGLNISDGSFRVPMKVVGIDNAVDISISRNTVFLLLGFFFSFVNMLFALQLILTSYQYSFKRMEGL